MGIWRNGEEEGGGGRGGVGFQIENPSNKPHRETLIALHSGLLNHETQHHGDNRVNIPLVTALVALV